MSTINAHRGMASTKNQFDSEFETDIEDTLERRATIGTIIALISYAADC